MAREPLDSFAQRIVKFGEIPEFVDALIEHGAVLSILIAAINKHRYVSEPIFRVVADKRYRNKCGEKFLVYAEPLGLMAYSETDGRHFLVFSDGRPAFKSGDDEARTLVSEVP